MSRRCAAVIFRYIEKKPPAAPTKTQTSRSQGDVPSRRSSQTPDKDEDEDRSGELNADAGEFGARDALLGTLHRPRHATPSLQSFGAEFRSL